MLLNKGWTSVGKALRKPDVGVCPWAVREATEASMLERVPARPGLVATSEAKERNALSVWSASM